MRPASLDPDMLDIDGFTIKGVTIATDQVIGTDSGEERLIISEESLDLDVFRTTGLNLIMNHEPNGVNLGKVINPQIVGGKLKGDIVFDETVPDAVDAYTAVVKGLAKDLSVGGYKNRSESTRMGKSTGQSVVVTEWEPFDVSFVGLAADPNCGFYRSASQKPTESARVTESANDLSFVMTQENKASAEAKNEQAEVKPESDQTKIERAAFNPKADPAPKAEDGKISRAGVKALAKLAKDYGVTDSTFDMWIDKGYSEDQAKLSIFDGKIERAQSQNPARFVDNVAKPANPYTEGNATVTLRAGIGALAKMKAGRTDFTNDEGLSREVSQQFQSSTEEGGPGFRVPFTASTISRAFTGLGANQGSNLTTTQVNMSDRAGYLFENTVTENLNIKVRRGAVNLVSIPLIDAVGEAEYIAENSAATESETSTGNLLLTPKPVIGLKRRTVLSQILNPGVQQELEEELMNMVRVAIDKAILVGKPNGPSGIASVAGVDKSASTVAGLKLADTTKLLEMSTVRNAMKEIRKNNVSGPISIVVDPEISNWWANQTVGKQTGNTRNKTLLWTTNSDASTSLERPGAIQGKPVYDSTNLRVSKPTADAADEYRAIIGAFQYCYSYFWGQTMKLEIGTSGNDFDSERVSIKLVAYHDTGIVYPEAFSSYKGVKIGPTE